MEYLEQIIAFLLASGAFTIAGVKIKDWAIKFKTNKFKISEHQMFSLLTRAEKEVKKWDTPANKRCLKDALLIKIKTWHEEAIGLSEKLDENKKLSDSQIEKVFYKWALKVVDIYSLKWHNARIPKEVCVIIDKKHQNKIDAFLDTLSDKAYNSVYLTRKIKYIAIFDALCLLLAETKNDFYDLIFKEVFNGNCKGLDYKGFPINEDEFQEFIAKKNKEK